MIVGNISELSIVGVYDRGVPNQERIVMRPQQEINMGRHGFFLGLKQPNGLYLPLYDHMFWFGDGIVQPPSWLFVYTGPGQARQAKTQDTQELAYVLHWGKKMTVLNDERIAPILFRVDAIQIAGVAPLQLGVS